MSETKKKISKSVEVLLKILSGNHQGAEIIIDNNVITIGKVDDCDLILSDSLIASKHARLEFIDNKWFIKPLEGIVFINGKRIQSKLQEVQVFEFITLGDIHFVLGPVNETWPLISASNVPELEHSELNNESSEEEASSQNAKANTILDENKEDNKKIANLEDLGTLSIERERKKFAARVWTIASFVLAFVLFLILSITNKPDVKKEEINTQNVINKIIQKNNLSGDVRVDKDVGGRLIVTGYVDKSSELSIIRSQLYRIDPSLKVKVYSDEKILSEARELLSNIISAPVISKVKPGVFVISGYVYDKAIWEKVRNKISEDIVGIVDLQDQVTLPQKAYSIARPIFAKFRLTSKVTIIPQEDQIVVAGIISSDEEENWKLAQKQLEKAFGSDIQLKNLVKVSDPEAIKKQYFGSNVSSVSIGDNGLHWIGLQDGSRYMMGSTLSNGYTIQEITPETIILTKNNQTIVLKTNEL